MKKKYILGAGISGLIFGFYNQDYTIISKDIGGQFNHYFNLGPRYLHNDKYSRKFLKDIDLPVKKRKIKIGYCEFNDTIQAEPNPGFLEKYFEKSRGVKFQEEKCIMSENKTELDILEVDFKHLISLLKEKLKERIINKNAKSIDVFKGVIVCDDDSIIEYDKLINTIPLNSFCKISKIKNINLTSKPITYVLCKNFIPNSKYFNYIYYCNNANFHRATIEKDNIVLDILGRKNGTELKEIFGSHYVDHFTLENAQIIPSDEKLFLPNNIKCVGRYGTWDREWKTETVIKHAIKFSKKKKWTE